LGRSAFVQAEVFSSLIDALQSAEFHNRLLTAYRRSETMIAIRGVYDGKTFSALPSEPLPQVQREIPVAIVFLEEVLLAADHHQHQAEVARRMRAARDAMPPLGMSVKELVEAGRER
jgi:hypothetical protein